MANDLKIQLRMSVTREIIRARKTSCGGPSRNEARMRESAQALSRGLAKNLQRLSTRVGVTLKINRVDFVGGIQAFFSGNSIDVVVRASMNGWAEMFIEDLSRLMRREGKYSKIEIKEAPPQAESAAPPPCPAVRPINPFRLLAAAAVAQQPLPVDSARGGGKSQLRESMPSMQAPSGHGGRRSPGAGYRGVGPVTPSSVSHHRVGRGSSRRMISVAQPQRADLTPGDRRGQRSAPHTRSMTPRPKRPALASNRHEPVSSGGQRGFDVNTPSFRPGGWG